MTEIPCMFDFINKCDPSNLLKVLINENEYIAATVLSAMYAHKSSLILQNLPEEKRQKIVELMLQGIKTSNELLEGIANHLRKRLEEMEASTTRTLGGVDEFVNVLNLMDRSAEKSVVSYLENNDPAFAKEIKKRMFVFEDIVRLDDRSVQKILREVDQKELAIALAMTDDAVKEKIFCNMSERAVESLKKDIEKKASLSQKDCEEMQLRIVSVIRRLEECGEIVIARG